MNWFESSLLRALGTIVGEITLWAENIMYISDVRRLMPKLADFDGLVLTEKSVMTGL